VGYHSQKANGIPINSKRMSKSRQVDWEAAVTVHAKAVHNAKMAYKKSNAVCKVKTGKKSESWLKLLHSEDTVTIHAEASYKCKSESFTWPYCYLIPHRSF